MPRRRGYVLLLTLLLLALAATVVGDIVAISLGRSVRAASAADELQRRWGTLSCQQAILPQAEQLLADAEKRSGRPVATIRTHLSLGNQQFDLVIRDEQARINVNQLADIMDEQELRRVAQFLVRASGSAAQVALRPTLNPPERKDPVHFPMRPYLSPEQLFAEASPAAWIEPPGREALGNLTCFGRVRKLHYRRASEAALMQIIDLLVIDSTKAGRELLRIRGTAPTIPLQDLLDKAQLSPDDRNRLEGALTSTSACHSLWIIVRGGQRAWHRWAVRDLAGSAAETYVFDW